MRQPRSLIGNSQMSCPVQHQHQHQHQYHHHHQQHHHQQQHRQPHLHRHSVHLARPMARTARGARTTVIRSSEYRNLRQVVPSLRRQRDLGKVEVVTEAAKYIDHLHKTLIKRFVACGIPESLKDVLGTDDANELNSQHIMNLVTQMAAKQRAGQRVHEPTSAILSSSNATRPAQQQQQLQRRQLSAQLSSGSNSRASSLANQRPSSTPSAALITAALHRKPQISASKRCAEKLASLKAQHQ